MKLLGTLFIASSLVSINSNAMEQTGLVNATASISASCRIKVDNMSFGDVTMQSMSGNGDVFANTQLSLLCTKDQTVSLQSDYGMNGVPSGTWDSNNSNCFFGGTGMPYNSCSSRNITSSFPSNGYRILRKNGATIAVGETPNIGGSAMKGGLGDTIRYELSLNNSFAVKITNTAGDTLTYNQNDGDWQNYTLYGKANVATARPDIYTDINTITITF